MEKGILYWITGLSGAGKTTIGTRLYYELKDSHPNIVILDGDILKNLVGDSLAYSKEDRLKRANHYSSLCKVLTDQGISVIICTIAMYDSVREWNRKNIEKYVEIYLKVDSRILLERDRKGLYSKQLSGQLTNLTGIDIKAEFPKNPDIVIENDGTATVAECVKKILAYQVQKGDSYKRDTLYWNSYYGRNHEEIKKPSNFAETILPELKKGGSLIDLGCGNGRDSIYFAEHGLQVIGIDASNESIYKLNQLNIDNACFVCDDFVSSKALYQIQYDYFYSRWSIHAISEHQEDELLKNVAGALKDEGLFFVEARSIRDELYGKGTCVAENAFIFNEHYRRFIDKDIFSGKLIDCGFEILFLQEDRGFSRTEASDPILIRIGAKKIPR